MSTPDDDAAALLDYIYRSGPTDPAEQHVDLFLWCRYDLPESLPLLFSVTYAHPHDTPGRVFPLKQWVPVPNETEPGDMPAWPCPMVRDVPEPEGPFPRGFKVYGGVRCAAELLDVLTEGDLVIYHYRTWGRDAAAFLCRIVAVLHWPAALDDGTPATRERSELDVLFTERYGRMLNPTDGADLATVDAALLFRILEDKRDGNAEPVRRARPRGCRPTNYRR